MFTGIVEAVSKVKKARPSKGGFEVWIVEPRNWRMKPGESINVNGVCSTIKTVDGGLGFYYMPETLDKTNLVGLKAGDEVNLERALRVDSRLSGHIVQGHIDARAKIFQIQKKGDSYLLGFELEKSFLKNHKFLASKGSVAVEGVSLTVVEVLKNGFTASLIPYTLQHTTFHRKRVGDVFNIEFDVLAKYLENLIKRK